MQFTFMTATIEIQNLTKRYGERIAVDKLNLTVNQGDIFGFIGPNGAGKTSTMRMVAGLLRPNSGAIKVAGYSVAKSPERVKAQIGYMPDYFGVYPDLKVWEYLDFFSACYKIPEGQRPSLLDGLLELVDLGHRKQDIVDSLSRGLKQRLSLARTLIHDPQVLILDEPAAGLDPRARVEIRELLVELAAMGKTIFFSSHILADVAEICTRVGIIEAGKLVAVGKLDELHLQIMPRRRVEITVLGKLEEALELLKSVTGVVEAEALLAPKEGERRQLSIEFTGDDASLSEALAVLVQQGIPVLHFNENLDLEEVFMRATKGLVT